MGGSGLRFSLFGMPVVIRPMFWIVAVLLGAPGGTSPRELAHLGIWICVLFVSILAHELGHAFAMRAFGRNPSIELWGLGGLTHWGAGQSVSPARNMVVSLAGPGAGFVLGAGVLLINLSLRPSSGSFAGEVVRQALFINIAWGIVNLFPILPLDGGRVLESFATWVGGDRGRRAAHVLSLALSIGAVAVALYFRSLWIAFLGLWCVSISYRTLVARPAEPEAEPALDEAKREAWRQLHIGQPQEAVKICQALLQAAQTNVERDQVLEIVAWAELEAGEDARALAARRQMTGSPSELLEARLLVLQGNRADGIARLERAARSRQDSFAALVLSSVYVREQRPDLSLALLTSERGAALSNGSQLAISAQLFHSEHYELAFRACETAFARSKDPRHAYNAACSLAQLGRLDEAIVWLERAIETGFSDVDAFDSDADLGPLRAHPRWPEVRSRAPRH